MEAGQDFGNGRREFCGLEEADQEICSPRHFCSCTQGSVQRIKRPAKFGFFDQRDFVHYGFRHGTFKFNIYNLKKNIISAFYLLSGKSGKKCQDKFSRRGQKIISE